MSNHQSLDEDSPSFDRSIASAADYLSACKNLLKAKQQEGKVNGVPFKQ
jgi:hypothetical protein